LLPSSSKLTQWFPGTRGSEDHRLAIQIFDHHVHVAVVEQIADRQSPRDAALLQRLSGLVACVTEGPVFWFICSSFG